MKLETYNILRNKNDLNSMLTDVQDIIDFGLYQTTETTSFPTDSPTEGESRIYANGSDIRILYYTSGAWRGSPLRNEQVGFGYITEAASPTASLSVSFPQSYAAAPLVFINYLGSALVSAGVPTGPGFFTGALTLRVMISYAVSTTGFTATIMNTSGGNLDSSYNSGFCWRAISL
jgi:hypothetical protein